MLPKRHRECRYVEVVLRDLVRFGLFECECQRAAILGRLLSNGRVDERELLNILQLEGITYSAGKKCGS